MFQIGDTEGQPIPLQLPEAWVYLCFKHSQFAFGTTIPQVWVSDVERLEEVPAMPPAPLAGLTPTEKEEVHRRAQNLLKFYESERGPRFKIVCDPDDEC